MGDFLNKANEAIVFEYLKLQKEILSNSKDKSFNKLLLK